MSNNELYLREREVRVLRDWLIPSTLIIGICISIILYILTLNQITSLLKCSAIASLVSISLLAFNLLFIFGVLGKIDLDKYGEESPVSYFHATYIISLIGILAFMVSLSLLCFTRSLLLGYICAILSCLVFVLTVWVAIKNE
jgi:uncharacterized membrane protein